MRYFSHMSMMHIAGESTVEIPCISMVKETSLGISPLLPQNAKGGHFGDPGLLLRLQAPSESVEMTKVESVAQ
jgi:hypothetical protein